MVRDPLSGEDAPDLEDVLTALEDEDCRRIIANLETPRNAGELQERCDIPKSTLYRKLDTLTDSTLVSEGTEIRSDGTHAGRYEVNFEEAVVAFDPDHEQRLRLEIERPARTADERLAELWSEVRKSS